MSQSEIRERVFYLTENYIGRLRETSPCYCVLDRHLLPCNTCPLNLQELDVRRRVADIIKQAVTEFCVAMIGWDEFKRTTWDHFVWNSYADYHRK